MSDIDLLIDCKYMAQSFVGQTSEISPIGQFARELVTRLDAAIAERKKTVTVAIETYKYPLEADTKYSVLLKTLDGKILCSLGASTWDNLEHAKHVAETLDGAVIELEKP